MKRTTALCVSIVLAGLLVGTTGRCASNDPQPMSPERWLADLEYLARELPARHVDPWHRIGAEQFQQAVAELRAKMPQLSNAQAAVELGRLVAMIGGGHTEISLTRSNPGFRRYPIMLRQFGKELYVVAASAPHVRALGARVLSIGDTLTRQAYDTVTPLLGHDNDMEFKEAAPRYLVHAEILQSLDIVPDVDRADWVLRGTDGEVFTLELEPVAFGAVGSLDWHFAGDAENLPLYRQRPRDRYWFEYLEDSRTLYFKYNRCFNQDEGPSIKAFAREMYRFVDSHTVERFVIDLRDNPGGNYHRNAPLIAGLAKRPALGERGRLFVILGHRTFSAAITAVADLAEIAEPIFVGERPRGRPNGQGDVKHFRLPASRIEVDHATNRYTLFPDLGDADYLALDIPVEISIEDYLAGRDPVLETILDLDSPN